MNGSVSNPISHLPTNEDDQEFKFDEVVEPGRPIVPQVKKYAKSHGIELELGWKTEVAKTAKSRLLGDKDLMKGEEELLEAWEALFEKLQPS